VNRVDGGSTVIDIEQQPASSLRGSQVAINIPDVVQPVDRSRTSSRTPSRTPSRSPSLGQLPLVSMVPGGGSSTVDPGKPPPDQAQVTVKSPSKPASIAAKSTIAAAPRQAKALNAEAEVRPL